MTNMRVAILGLAVLAACAGCTTGTRSAMNGTNGHGSASPMTYQMQNCDLVYNAAVGVCESPGD